MLAVGKPERAAALIALDDLAAELERRAEEPGGGLDLAGQHESADVARGDDLAVDLDQRHDPRLEPPVRGQHLGIAGRAVSEPEVLPHRHARRVQPLDQDVVDELRRRLVGEPVVERDHDQLVDAERPISSALASRLVSSFGAASGRTTRSGCGSNVSTVSLPRITSRCPRWTPSNSPTATRRGRSRTSESIVTCIGAEG